MKGTETRTRKEEEGQGYAGHLTALLRTLLRTAGEDMRIITIITNITIIEYWQEVRSEV